MNWKEDLKKLNLKNICIFIVGLSIVLGICGALIAPKGYTANDVVGTTSVLNRLKKEKEDTLDVMFAGDSCMTYGVSPLQIWGEYGYKTYNLSYQAAKICDTYAVLKESLKTQSPKMLVLDCDSLFMDGRIYQTEDQVLNTVEQVFSVFHYHMVYKLLSPSISFYGKKIYPDQLYKGFRVKAGVIPYTGGKYMKKNTKSNQVIQDVASEMGTDSENYLNQIYELCKENQIQLLLVNVPAPNLWDEDKHDIVQEWADEYNVNYLDMNEYTDEIGMNWDTDTADGGGHLNLSGSEKVTSYMGSYLQKNYQLSSYSDDQEWKAAYNLAAVYGDKK